MKNPLNKRLPKEFIGDIGKYCVIFIFMAATIGLISGFLVSDSSLIKAYDESFEKYNIEDGDFEVKEELNENTINNIVKEDEVLVYENFYVEKSLIDNEKTKATIRIFKNREEVNKVCLMSGKMPSDDNDIAIDRLFAINNSIEVGDIINVAGKELKVSGYVALSDYSSMFENNNDIMLDATMFGVAIMTEEGYDNYTDGLVHYNYSWKYKNTPKDKEEEINKSDVFLNSLNSQVEILNYIPRYSNQAINFAGDDMGGDKSMMIVLLYILIVIMAFVFGVTINNTIVKESMVIGTLRASGYTRGELLRHYISLPILTTLIASIVGNILGYTVIKDVCANLYYNSYSLTTYKTLWNSEAFLLTTVIPILIMLAINICIISYKLRMSPLKFIRNDLSSSKKKKAIKLPNFKFLSRYRIRVIIQNKSNYITLLIGIIFANILLLFGMMMKPLLHHFADESLNKMISDYQYVLKTPVETDTEGAEKYSVTSLETTDKKFKEEDITVYGITENSEYISEEIANDEIYVSSLYAEKYGLKKGSAIILKNEYNGEKFNFKISGIYDYPSSMAIFMSRDYFNNIFSKDTDYYNGYFTNNKLEDIDETYILSVIDENDMTKISRQMDKSMGGMMSIVDAFAIIMFAILIYLLTKLVIEKNSNSISMLKILGYNSGEISKIYLLSTTIVVIIATIISMFLATLIIKMLYVEIMSDMTGWIPFYIKYSIYPKMFAMGIGTYFVVLMLQYRRIRHISMSDALKNVE